MYSRRGLAAIVYLKIDIDISGPMLYTLCTSFNTTPAAVHACVASTCYIIYRIPNYRTPRAEISKQILNIDLLTRMRGRQHQTRHRTIVHTIADQLVCCVQAVHAPSAGWVVSGIYDVHRRGFCTVWRDEQQVACVGVDFLLDSSTNNRSSFPSFDVVTAGGGCSRKLEGGVPTVIRHRTTKYHTLGRASNPIFSPMGTVAISKPCVYGNISSRQFQSHNQGRNYRCVWHLEVLISVSALELVLWSVLYV